MTRKDWQVAFDSYWWEHYRQHGDSAAALHYAQDKCAERFGQQPPEDKQVEVQHISKLRIIREIIRIALGLTLGRRKMMNYDWKKGLIKFATVLLYTALTASAAALAVPDVWQAAKDIPTIGPIIVLLGPPLMAWLVNLLKHWNPLPTSTIGK